MRPSFNKISKMKVAVCLFGNIGGYGGSESWRQNPIPPSLCRDSVKDVLMDHYDTDVFLHSWSVDRREEILGAWKPEGAIIEKQKVFSPQWSDYKNYATGRRILEPFDLAGERGWDIVLMSRGTYDEIYNEFGPAGKNELRKGHSRWYSSKKSIELKSQYEMKNNFTYDFVLVCRFDVWFDHKFELEGLSSDRFYASPRTAPQGPWPDCPTCSDSLVGAEDLWFLVGGNVADKFATLYDNIGEYCPRPPVATRQHIREVIGIENLEYLPLFWGFDYGVIRNGRYYGNANWRCPKGVGCPAECTNWGGPTGRWVRDLGLCTRDDPTSTLSPPEPEFKKQK